MNNPKPKITFSDLPEVFANRQKTLSLKPPYEEKGVSVPEHKVPLIKDENKNTVQIDFLEKCVKNNIYVYIFLVNGVKLKGIISKFDMFSILLKDEKNENLIMKHSISTIVLAEKS